MLLKHTHTHTNTVCLVGSISRRALLDFSDVFQHSERSLSEWMPLTPHHQTGLHFVKYRLDKWQKKVFFVNKGNQIFRVMCSCGWIHIISASLVLLVLLTYPESLAIVVAWVRVKCTQVHPAKTHFILGIIEEATDISPSLWRRVLRYVECSWEKLLVCGWWQDTPSIHLTLGRCLSM